MTAGAESLELRIYSALLRPRLVDEAQLEPFLAAHGLSPLDVRAVILTHFHADHISATRDLPNAVFYASGPAYRQLRQWSAWKRIRHGVFLDLLPSDFERRVQGFEDAPEAEAPLGLGPGYDLFSDGTVLVVPLPGHAIGHAGVVFPGLSPPLLYAADAEWLHGALSPGRSGIAARLVNHDMAAAEATRARICTFERLGGRVVLCHDPEPVS